MAGSKATNLFAQPTAQHLAEPEVDASPDSGVVDLICNLKKRGVVPSDAGGGRARQRDALVVAGTEEHFKDVLRRSRVARMA